MDQGRRLRGFLVHRVLRDPVPSQGVAIQPGALQIEFVEVVDAMERAGIDMPYERTVVEVAPS